MTDNWEQVKRLFIGAVALPEAQRPEFLDRACDEPAIRCEVEELLAAEQRATSALDPGTSVRRALGHEPPEPERSECIGPWRLERPLGRGGMGIVWLARREDEHFEMRAALKLVKHGLDTDAVLARFRRERQVLADLEHPNIARLIDGGATEEGRPWLAMEYVDGQPIDHSCDARKLDIEGRLELFATVCDAVAAAHRQRIIHRDIKPGNILVTADGVPKLLDFGIAKLLVGDTADEAPDLTATGERLLTPRYASPEQLRGEQVSPATDVFSLGVVLYELLTGCRTHPETTTQQELEQAVCREDPARPSTTTGGASEALVAARSTDRSALRRRLRGDVDTIVMAALQKDPGRRYEGAAALAADVRGHLAGLPILARPDSLSYRGGKYVRRHKLLISAATLVAVVSVSAALSSKSSAADARAAEQQALDEQRKASGLFESLLGLSTDSALRFAEAVKDVVGTKQMRLDLLDDVVSNLDQLRELDPGNAEVRQRLAMVLARRGKTRGGAGPGGSAGQYEAALLDLERSSTLLRALATESPVPSPHDSKLLDVQLDHAVTLIQHQRHDDARVVLAEARDAAERLGAEGFASTGDLENAMRVQVELGRLSGLDGDHEAALEAFGRNADLARAGLERNSGDVDAMLRAASSRGQLAAPLSKLGRLEEASEAFEAGIAILDEALALAPERASLQGDRVQQTYLLARMLAQRGLFDEAVTRNREAIDWAERFLDAEPENAVMESQLGEIWYQLGDARAGQARVEGTASADRAAYLGEAEDALARSLGIMERLEREGRLHPRYRGALPQIQRLLDRTRSELASLEGELGD